MRKSITAGLTLSAAVMACAGQPHAHASYPVCVAGDARGADCRTSRDQCAVGGKKREFGSACIQNAYAPSANGPVFELASLKHSKSVKPVYNRPKQPRQVVETPESQFRIPAHPIVRDCIHVFFPQCSSRGGLNDGAYELPY
jgi:hypothetical protein